MPLKPIFVKAPLKGAALLPLYPGQAVVDKPMLKALLTLAAADDRMEVPVLWEGIYRAAMLLKDPVAAKTEALIRAAMIAQHEDGSIGADVNEGLCVVRAAVAVYENTTDRALLESIVKWCASLSADWAAVIAEKEIRCHPADLAEVLHFVYTLTGKKVLLTMLDKLRRDGMDWAGVLNTFAVQRDMAHVTSVKDLEAGLAAEDGSEQGFYTRQALICRGESLADGARAAMLNGMFSGNGQELAAARKGWERIVRFHGSVCGAVNCDDMLGGLSPASAVDAAAVGAWLETLTKCDDGSGWAWDAAAVMLGNAAERLLLGGELHDLFRTNSLKADAGAQGCYKLMRVGEDRTVHALARLLRGVSAFMSRAVSTAPYGIRVSLLHSGVFTVLAGGTVVKLTVETGDCCAKVTVSAKKSAAFVLSVRMPGWANDAQVTVNETPAQSVQGAIEVYRTWDEEDTLTFTWHEELRMLSGHHQGVAVMKGSTLYAMPACDQWAVAACGEAELAEDGQVLLPVAPVEGWRVKGAVPHDLPVLPAVQGEACKAALKPFGECFGIALFPKAGV